MIDKELLKTNLISLLGLEDASDERKRSVINKSANIIQKKVSMRVMKKMNEKQKNQFLQALEAEDEVTVDRLVKENVDNLEDIVKEEVDSIKSDLKKTIDNLDI